MPDTALRSATRLVSEIRRGKIGSLELLDHYIARMERFNPDLNAIIATDIPNARKRAMEADRACAAGEFWGPLHGLPMTVKDSFDVAGLPTTWGVPRYKDTIAQSDAFAVKQLRDAGAIIFGKTNVPAWLADSQTFNEIYGTTRNPWNPECAPGGSSGGAAAALAAGMTGLELGSDIAGSIRNPAAYCGLFGHKPTMGLCSTRGHTLDGKLAPLDMLVVGPLARSAADLQRVFQIIARPDEFVAPGIRVHLPLPHAHSLGDFRVAVLLEDQTVPMTRQIPAMHAELVDLLRDEGVDVRVDVRPDFDPDHANRVFDILLRAATSGRQTDEEYEANLQARRQLKASDDSKAARKVRAETLSHRDWLRFNEERYQICWKWHEFFQKHDLLLAPITVSSAMTLDHTPPYERSISVDGQMVPFMNQVSLPGYANLAYLPSTVVPLGCDDNGLPIGIQIIGPRYSDRTCLRFARLLERAGKRFVPPSGYA